MSIKNFSFGWFRIVLFPFVFLVGFICAIIVVFLLCNANIFNGADISSGKINVVRAIEIAEGNYEIENWTAYEEKNGRLLFCDGSLFEYGPKYAIFRLSNGFLFGSSFEESVLREDEENNLPEYPYIRLGNLLWMKENLSIQPKEKDFVLFDAVAGLKVMPKSTCMNEKKSDCEKYGRFYDFSSALSVCPSGWRLPKNEDWMTLKGKVDSLKFANVFAGSCRKNDSGIYECLNEGTDAIWWSDAPDGNAENSNIILNDDDSFFYIAAEQKNDFTLHTVRCVKEVN